jgi:hypothetical protein
VDVPLDLRRVCTTVPLSAQTPQTLAGLFSKDERNLWSENDDNLGGAACEVSIQGFRYSGAKRVLGVEGCLIGQRTVLISGFLLHLDAWSCKVLKHVLDERLYDIKRPPKRFPAACTPSRRHIAQTESDLTKNTAGQLKGPSVQGASIT